MNKKEIIKKLKAADIEHDPDATVPELEALLPEEEVVPVEAPKEKVEKTPETIHSVVRDMEPAEISERLNKDEVVTTEERNGERAAVERLEKVLEERAEEAQNKVEMDTEVSEFHPVEAKTVRSLNLGMTKEQFKGVIENYKARNPVKYAAKKDSLNKQLAAIKN